MPGKNPDPAFSIDDVVKLIHETFEPMPEKIATAVASAQRQIIKEQSAPRFQAFTRQLAVGVPAILVGADRNRSRLMLRASTDDVFIGSLNELSSGFGYPLPTAAGDEIKTTDDIYVLYNPSGSAASNPRVAVWLERSE